MARGRIIGSCERPTLPALDAVLASAALNLFRVEEDGANFAVLFGVELWRFSRPYSGRLSPHRYPKQTHILIFGKDLRVRAALVFKPDNVAGPFNPTQPLVKSGLFGRLFCRPIRLRSFHAGSIAHLGTSISSRCVPWGPPRQLSEN